MDLTEQLAIRQGRARARMDELGVDVALLSVGADLPYLTGYEAMPLERLTMLVLPRGGDASLVVPELEAPRVVPRPGVFELRAWTETEDPIAIVAGLVGPAARRVAIGDHTWARFVLQLQDALPAARLIPASEVTGPLRSVKDARGGGRAPGCGPRGRCGRGGDATAAVRGSHRARRAP